MRVFIRSHSLPNRDLQRASTTGSVHVTHGRGRSGRGQKNKKAPPPTNDDLLQRRLFPLPRAAPTQRSRAAVAASCTWCAPGSRCSSPPRRPGARHPARPLRCLPPARPADRRGVDPGGVTQPPLTAAAARVGSVLLAFDRRPPRLSPSSPACPPRFSPPRCPALPRPFPSRPSPRPPSRVCYLLQRRLPHLLPPLPVA